MPDKNGYTIIPPDLVQPGDIFKFIPVGEDAPLFAQVLEVLPGQNLVRIRRKGGESSWTYISPPAGEVTFGRKVTGPVSANPSDTARAGPRSVRQLNRPVAVALAAEPQQVEPLHPAAQSSTGQIGGKT
jgi:hypothetical protein